MTEDEFALAFDALCSRIEAAPGGASVSFPE